MDAQAQAKKLKERLDALEAQRLIDTIELRHELVRAARRLLPEAIRQAKPKGRKPGSPALLRLVARVAQRTIKFER